jgi:hypothetical protein
MAQTTKTGEVLFLFFCFCRALVFCCLFIFEQEVSHDANDVREYFDWKQVDLDVAHKYKKCCLAQCCELKDCKIKIFSRICG